MHKQKEYKNYLFDLYGTLVDIHTDEERKDLWEKLSLFYGYYGAIYTPQELQESYLLEVQSHKKQLVNAGTISHEAHPEIKLEYVFQKLFQKKGIDADLMLSTYTGQMFRTLSTEYICLYEGAVSLLKALKKAGKQVYLLSNAQNIFTRYELKYLGIDTLFDDIFISSEYGCKKPDSNFYMKPIEKYQLKPEETIMIGNDYQCDIVGAREVGLDTFYIHSNLSPEMTEEIISTYQIGKMDLQEVQEILEI